VGKRAGDDLGAGQEPQLSPGKECKLGNPKQEHVRKTNNIKGIAGFLEQGKPGGFNAILTQ